MESKMIQVRRMGYAPATCPTTPSLESAFYADAGTIASAAHGMVRPEKPAWAPDPERAKLGDQEKFGRPL